MQRLIAIMSICSFTACITAPTDGVPETDVASQIEGGPIEVLSTARTAAASSPGDPGLVEGPCQYLGCNSYCQGTTEVYSFDYLCNNGEIDYVQSTTVLYPGSAYCEGM